MLNRKIIDIRCKGEGARRRQGRGGMMGTREMRQERKGKGGEQEGKKGKGRSETREVDGDTMEESVLGSQNCLKGAN
jgi:hypothetical protein